MRRGSGGKPDGGRRGGKCQAGFEGGMSGSDWLAARDDEGFLCSGRNCRQILEIWAVIFPL